MKKTEDIYEKLPLFDIELRWGSTEAGKSLGSTLNFVIRNMLLSTCSFHNL